MILFFSRVKNLFPAAKWMLNSEAVGVRFCSSYKRALCANNYLILNAFIHNQKTEPFNRRNYHRSENIPENFGKIVELDEEFNEVVTNDEKLHKEVKRKRKNIQNKHSESSEIENEIKEKPSEPLHDRKTYKDINRNVNLLSSLLSNLKSKKHREKNKEFMIEGKRLIKEALSAGLIPKKIFFTGPLDLEGLSLPEGTETLRVPYRSCQLWAETATHQGIIGIFKIPIPKPFQGDADCMPVTVICDNVRDPSNLGSVIRVVAGAGCEKLILTKGCTSIWEQKVLRASAGAVFHLPILTNMTWTEIEDNISETSEVFIADNNAELDNKRDNNIFTSYNKEYEHLTKSSYFSVEFQKKNTVFVLGGETHGLSDEAYKFAEKRNGTRLFIPINSKIESLNVAVALGILTFDFKRQTHSSSQKESNVLETYSGSKIS